MLSTSLHISQHAHFDVAHPSSIILTQAPPQRRYNSKGRRHTTVDIGSLIVRTPDIRGGRPRIAGTGMTVSRIAQWHIAAEIEHLSLAQIHAALTYYHANRAEIGADIAADAADAEAILRQHQ